MTVRQSKRARAPGRPAHDDWVLFLHIESRARNSGKSINEICDSVRIFDIAMSRNGLCPVRRIPTGTIKRRYYMVRRAFLDRHPLPADYRARHPRSLGPFIDAQIAYLGAG